MADDPAPRLLRRLWLRIFATAGVVAAIGLSWWWKVDEARTPDQLATTGLGLPIDLGRTLFTPEKLVLRSIEGESELVMTAMIENVTGETQVAMFGMPAHPPQAVLDDSALPDPTINLIRDNSPLYQLQPRLPERIELVWEVPDGWEPGDLTVRFERQRFKIRDNLYGKSNWLGFVPEAQMTVRPDVE